MSAHPWPMSAHPWQSDGHQGHQRALKGESRVRSGHVSGVCTLMRAEKRLTVFPRPSFSGKVCLLLPRARPWVALRAQGEVKAARNPASSVPPPPPPPPLPPRFPRFESRSSAIAFRSRSFCSLVACSLSACPTLILLRGGYLPLACSSSWLPLPSVLPRLLARLGRLKKDEIDERDRT
jgi:hypothetical protein